jgi:ankyrin repeat protein
MRACALGNTDIVQVLLSYHPKIGITNKNSQTAYQLICQRVAAESQKERIRNLLNVKMPPFICHLSSGQFISPSFLSLLGIFTCFGKKKTTL